MSSRMWFLIQAYTAKDAKARLMFCELAGKYR